MMGYHAEILTDSRRHQGPRNRIVLDTASTDILAGKKAGRQAEYFLTADLT